MKALLIIKKENRPGLVGTAHLLADATAARLIKKVYGADPLICPECGSEMKILSVIFNPDEIKKILTHLAKIGRAPPNFDPASLVAEASSTR